MVVTDLKPAEASHTGATYFGHWDSSQTHSLISEQHSSGRVVVWCQKNSDANMWN